MTVIELHNQNNKNKNVNVIDLLNTEPYKYELFVLPKMYYTQQTKNFQDLNFFGEVYCVFDELAEALGVAPPVSDYTKEYISRAKAFFTTNTDKSGFKTVSQYDYTNKRYYYCSYRWGIDLELAVKQRALKAYQSYLVEWLTIKQLKALYPGSRVIYGDTIDTVFGVDIVLHLKDKVLYLHIISNTKWGYIGYNKKANRSGVYKKNNNIVKWDRHWGIAHKTLAFDRVTSISTEIINGNVKFKDDYLKHYIDSCFIAGCWEPYNKTSNSLYDFRLWLESNNIKRDWSAV